MNRNNTKSPKSVFMLSQGETHGWVNLVSPFSGKNREWVRVNRFIKNDEWMWALEQAGNEFKNPKAAGKPSAGVTLPDSFRPMTAVYQEASDLSLQALNAVKSADLDPEELARFIARHGTTVHSLSGNVVVRGLIALLGFQPGFIPAVETTRFRLLKSLLPVLSLLPGGRKFQASSRSVEEQFPSISTDGLFIVTRNLFTISFFTHQLHHWLACRSGQSGYDERAQALYREFWNRHDGNVPPDIEAMGFEDVIALKAAINRELEALEFLKMIAREVLAPTRQARQFSSARRASA